MKTTRRLALLLLLGLASACAGAATKQPAGASQEIPVRSEPRASALTLTVSASAADAGPSDAADAGAAPVVASARCAGDADCGMDPETSACRVGGENPGPIWVEGPVCACSSGQCVLTTQGPVPCRSWRDCSWVRVPRLHPVPASEHPRPTAHPVRPCRDGEIDSVCDVDGGAGVCRVVAWSC